MASESQLPEAAASVDSGPVAPVSSPFGTPAILCAVLTAELPLTNCAAPELLHRRTRNRGRVLFASQEGVKQTLVVTRAPLRLTVRGDTANMSLLELAVAPLLRALRERVPTASWCGPDLRMPVAVPDTDAAAGDGEVLQEPSVLDPIRALLGILGDREQAAVPIGVYGALGFDLVDRFEGLGPRRADPSEDADVELVLGLDVVRYDVERGVVQVVTRGLPWESMSAVHDRHAATLSALQEPEVAREVPGTSSEREDDQPEQAFVDGVTQVREHIAAGDVFQAVLSRSVHWKCDADSLDVFERLVEREPAPYTFHLALERGALFGASPETCVRVEAGQVEIRPIAGTTLRSPEHETDQRLALALLFDRKERAEHVMLLDLARNDIARVAEPGTTEVVQQFAIEKYSRVQHLVSRVRGTLRSDLDALHAYRAAANMGTLSGAPKARATEIIRELEPAGRGFYGGAVVCLFADGQMDSCIVIRSMRAIDGVYRAQAGAGIVWHSDPQCELQETQRKLRAVSDVMATFAVQPAIEVGA